MISCLSRIVREDSSLADGHSTNHCYQSVPRTSIILRAQNRAVPLWEGDLSLSKVYEESLGYAEGNSLTTQSFYTALYSVEHCFCRILFTLDINIDGI